MGLKLPVTLNSKQDITHVHRELRSFLDAISQSKIRGDNPIKFPAITDVLRDVAAENKLDLTDEKVCQKLLGELEELKNHAPSVHISFPAEPPEEVLQKLIVWLRKEISPIIIIQVGLQPSIAAGIVLRTPNRQFDFSLRQHLYKNRDKLKDALTVVEAKA